MTGLSARVIMTNLFFLLFNLRKPEIILAIFFMSNFVACIFKTFLANDKASFKLSIQYKNKKYLTSFKNIYIIISE